MFWRGLPVILLVPLAALPGCDVYPWVGLDEQYRDQGCKDRIWFRDADRDGFGDRDDVGRHGCQEPPGNFVRNRLDCDDRQATVHPDQEEFCDGVDTNCDGEAGAEELDEDGDRYLRCGQPGEELYGGLRGGDCADDDPSVHPDADEGCDGIDTDCFEGPDAAEVDDDGDGFVECAWERAAWLGASVTGGGDCDDMDPLRNPAAEEICDGVDNDCDGRTHSDELDYDGDGFRICDGDCDDQDEKRYPRAPEICDGQPNDCHHTGPLWADEADQDNDGYIVCDPSTENWRGGVYTGFGDCDDLDPAVFPGAAELCDGLDNDCSGSPGPDEIDGDGDGFIACADCDDGDPAIHPGTVEVCDGVDNDCQGGADDGLTFRVYYADLDGDGYGDPGSVGQSWCADLQGKVDNFADCNDDPNDADNDGLADGAAFHPGAEEYCDGIDWDCDGSGRDYDSLDANTYYPDADGDSYGEQGNPQTYCDLSPPPGMVYTDTDCDDTRSEVHPGLPEVCDGLDNDCNTEVDDQPVVDDATWYADEDGDLWGDVSRRACADPGGWVLGRAGDCADLDPTVHPDVAEDYSDGIDNDCDGLVDGGALVDEAIAIRGASLRFGTSVVLPGDVDGDGLAEVIATTQVPYNPSYAYVFDWPSSPSPTVADAVTHVYESNLGSRLVMHEGADRMLDLTGNGSPDLVLGGKSTLPCQPDHAYVYEVGPGWTDSTHVSSTSAYAGVVGNLGADAHYHLRHPTPIDDADGDSVADLAVTTSYNPSGCSSVDPNNVAHLIFRGPLRNAASSDWIAAWEADTEIRGIAATEGGSQAPLGDADGDGATDLLFGQSGAGVFLWLGPVPGGLLSHADASLTVTSSTSSQSLGAALNPGVDLNDDGRRDVLLKARSDGPVYLLDGSTLVGHPQGHSFVLEDVAEITWSPELAGDGFGSGQDRVQAGDLNGDGHLDVVTAAPGNDDAGNNAGKVYVFWGPFQPASYLAADAGRFWLGEVIDGALTLGGISADLDGGGRPDIVLSDYYWDAEKGSVYLIDGESL